MGFRTGAFASVWSVEEGRGNTLKVRLSVSRKNKQTDEYEQEFSGFCTFIGNAKVKAEKLKAKDRIKLGDVDVTTWFNRDKGIEYVTYKVFDFEYQNGSGGTGGNNAQKQTDFDVSIPEGESDEEELPF